MWESLQQLCLLQEQWLVVLLVQPTVLQGTEVLAMLSSQCPKPWQVLKMDQILFLFTQMGPLPFIPVGKKSQAEGSFLVACIMQVIVWVRPADEAAS